MSSDQITYVLVALVVTGVAILLLLAGALFARRGRTGDGRAAPATGPDLAVSAPLPPAPAPAPLAAVPPPPLPATVGGSRCRRRCAAGDRGHRGARCPAGGRPGTGRARCHPGGPGGGRPTRARPARPGGHRGLSLDLAPAPRDRRLRRGVAADRHGFGGCRRGPRDRGGGGAVGSLHRPRHRASTSLLAWERALAEENARYVALPPPGEVVVAGARRPRPVRAQFGAEPARRILTAVGDAMRRCARRTDRVAHVGGGRFLVLLPETDEIQAINYVERVRAECERWLDGRRRGPPPCHRLGEPQRRRRARHRPARLPRSGCTPSGAAPPAPERRTPTHLADGGAGRVASAPPARGALVGLSARPR